MPGYGEEHRIPRGLPPDIEERLEIETGETYERGVQAGIKLTEDSMPSKRMVPEDAFAELRAEIATLRDSRDTQQALAQRFWNDLQTARNEIAALTEQRDRAMAVVAAARYVADTGFVGQALYDALAVLASSAPQEESDE